MIPFVLQIKESELGVREESGRGSKNWVVDGPRVSTTISMDRSEKSIHG